MTTPILQGPTPNYLTVEQHLNDMEMFFTAVFDAIQELTIGDDLSVYEDMTWDKLDADEQTIQSARGWTQELWDKDGGTLQKRQSDEERYRATRSIHAREQFFPHGEKVHGH